MDLDELRTLRELASAPLDEVERRAPELFRHVQELRVETVRGQLAETLTARASGVRPALDEADLASSLREGRPIKDAVLAAVTAAEMNTSTDDLSSLLDGLENAGQLSDPLLPEHPLAEQPLLAAAFQQAELVAVTDLAAVGEDVIHAVLELGKPVAALETSMLTSLAEAGAVTEREASSLGLTVGLYNLVDGDAALAAAIKSRVAGVRDLAAISAEDWRDVMAEANVTPPLGSSQDDAADRLARRVAALLPTDTLFARLVPRDTTALAARLEEAGDDGLDSLAKAYPGLGLGELATEPDPSTRAECVAERIGLLGRLRDDNDDVELLALDLTPDSPDLQTLHVDGIPAEHHEGVFTTLRACQRVHRLTGDPAVSQALLAAGCTGSADIVKDGLDAFTARSGLPRATARQVFDSATQKFGEVASAVGAVLDTAANGSRWTAVANLAPGIEDYLKGVPGFAELFGARAACRCEHCQSVLSPAAYFVDLMGVVERHVLDVYFPGAAATDELHLKVRRPDLWDLPLTCRNTEELVPTLEIVNGVLEDNIARHAGFAGELSGRPDVEKAVYEDTLSRSRRSFRQPFWLPLERLGTYLSHFERTRADATRVLGAPDAVHVQATLGLSRPEYDLIVTPNTDADFLRALYGAGLRFADQGVVAPFDVQLMLAPAGVSRDEIGALLATGFVTAGSSRPIEIRAEKSVPDSVQNDIERVHGLTEDALDRLHRFVRLHARLPWSAGELDLLLTQFGGGTLSEADLRRVAALRALGDELGLAPEDLCALVGEIPRRPVSPDGVSLFDRAFNRPEYLTGARRLPQASLTFLHPAFASGPAPAETASMLHRLLAALRVDDATLHQLIVELALPLGLDLDSKDQADKAFALTAANLSLLHRHARLAEMLDLPVPELFRMIELGCPATDRALVHYSRPADDYDVPPSATWGLHLWGDGLARGTETSWEAPLEPVRVDDYGAVYEVPLADPRKPVNFVVHLPGQGDVPTTCEPGGDRSFLPGRHREVWLRQGDLDVRHAALVRDLDDVRSLLAFRAWTAESGYTLDDLGLLTGGRVADPRSHPDPVLLADDVVAQVREDDALSFADTVFAFLPGVTEEQSRAVVGANTSKVAADAGGASCRLQDSFDPATPLTIPDGVAVAEPAAREVLLAYHYSRVLPTRLAGAWGIAPDKARALLGLAGMTERDGALAAALRGAGGARPLSTLLAATVPLHVLFRHQTFDAAALAFAAAHPGVFGATDFTAPELAVVRALSRYAALATLTDTDFTTAARPVNPSELRAVLLAFTADTGFTLADQAMLARVLRTEPGLAATVQSAMRLPAKALAALDKLADGVALARHLGVGGDALAFMTAEDYPALTRAADAVLGAFRARYSDERALTAALAPFEDRLQDRRRDALVDHLIHALQLPFRTRSDLYHYFLIDVELEGCARTTRVAAAIGSVQLYVQRILANLEQDRRAPADPAHVHIPPTAIPAGEWTWRRNYRVWEANRKVFLYPENYLEPELRDLKSPGFETLEEDLLARPIDDPGVLEAYAGYLRGFEEVAKLQLAGTWCDRTGGADTTHFIGTSATDPPRFYHRTAENLHRTHTDGKAAVAWSAWRPIEIQVPVRSVAPVVHAGRLRLFWTQFATQPKTAVSGGNATFPGYDHRMEVKYCTLTPDGTWAAPQSLALTNADGTSAATVADPRNANGVPKYSVPPVYHESNHPEARVDYALRGPNWDVYPELVGGVLQLVARNAASYGRVDLYNNRIAWAWTGPASGVTRLPMLSSRPANDAAALDLYTGTPPLARTRPNAWANMVIDSPRYWYWRRDYPLPNISPGLPPPWAGLWEERIATIPSNAQLRAVNGAVGDGIVQTDDEVLLVQPVPATTGGTAYAVRRLGTTVADGLGERRFIEGIDGLLATGHQLSLRERPSTLVPQGPKIVTAPDRDLDYTGANGTYFRELFFHIPFLIANHLNSQGRYTAARRWYHFIFDPTAAERLHNDFRDISCAVENHRLHVCGSTADGGIWHRVLRSSGTWEPAFTDLKSLEGDVGSFTSVDCAVAGGAHVCGTTEDGRLWHTLQRPDGAWQGGFGDVKNQAGQVGRFSAVACTGSGTALHVCAVTDNGRLWHTLRNPNGSWTPFTDVVALTGDVGPFVEVTCAQTGAFLQVCGRTADGRLWHTRQLADGTWEGPFAAVAERAGSVGSFVTVSCSAAGEQLDLYAAMSDGRLWHTTRQADGAWAWFDDLADDAGDSGRPRAVASAEDDGTSHVCCVGADGRMRHASRRPDASWRSFDDGLQSERDRVWRYREFRGLDAPRLREILTDHAAVDAYRLDPLNPHAIARLRLSAYQKAIVMKYVDNLLDWGDSLFSEGTAESVNEATLLYITAQDILGPPPAELGECGEGTVTPRSYARIAPLVAKGSEFLIEAETLALAGASTSKAKLSAQAVLGGTTLTAAQDAAGVDSARPALAFRTDWARPATGDTDVTSFGVSLLRQVGPVFCVPPNRELHAYWQRVEDRLSKIRNCQDIAGVPRELSPFAAAIDPRALVRARAAGIPLEDVLNATSGNLPPYRFAYLIDRAKQHASVVQGFGAALLGALEKKDVEELARLRAVHQQNLLALGTQARQWEIDAAQETIDALEAQKAAAEYRGSYFEDLIDTGLTPWEKAQAAARHTASVIYGAEGLFGLLYSIFSVIPQLGSPFAMKYGGMELKGTAAGFAHALNSTAKVAEAIGASAALQAGFERRAEGWTHQKELAGHDVTGLDRQIEGARLRKKIAEESLALHKRSIEQAEEVYDLYKSKFSHLGLYTQLAGSLQRLHREAYNGAYAMARLAEQALRFERGDDIGAGIGTGHWDASRAGLLAGERLSVDLLSLERRFLETNHRGLEIDQSFSLTQIDPAALVRLRQTGTCDFVIPEVFFDIFYPGHYCRRIRAVRLTIPSVTGPYVNVSATLTLLSSKIRPAPLLGAAGLRPVPRRRSVSIATSTAQADSGVFEMSFRDERYMPFEGQGAVDSAWQVTLPKTFRPFDYQTINDAILTLSYTAEEDGTLRGAVERENGAVEGAIHRYLSDNSVPRVFSLRQDFSETFHRLLHSPVGTDVPFTVTDKYFPAFLADRDLTVTAATLVLRPKKGQSTNGLILQLDGTDFGTFTGQDDFGGLPGTSLGALFSAGLVGDHALRVVAAGQLAPLKPPPGDTSALEERKLLDVMLCIEYRLKTER